MKYMRKTSQSTFEIATKSIFLLTQAISRIMKLVYLRPQKSILFLFLIHLIRMSHEIAVTWPKFHSLQHFLLHFSLAVYQQSAKTLQRLFVYGTLKAGEPNHQILKDSANGMAKYWCKATTTIKMPLVIGTRYNIPFLINKPGMGSYVTGEIYEVDDGMMHILDNLEDCQRIYERAVQPMNMGIGEG